jgi:hypothetical protein
MLYNLGGQAMSDVSAVVLSIGEAYTDRALASVRRQTLPAAEVIVVRNVSPFHCALNAGAARVRTPFFVQVDADTILDSTCFAELRACMGEGVAIASGFLRDPILGRAHGIRLYRTRCFEQVLIRNSISPDMDFGIDIVRHGWVRLHALRYQGEWVGHWHTFGDHRPDYTPHYTFCKFILEGIRSRYRRREGRVGRIFQQLRASDHRVAMVALIATAHGLFLREQRDLLVPYQRTPEFELLEAFLAARGEAPGALFAAADGANGDRHERFNRAYELGVACRQHGASTAFVDRLQRLKQHGGLDAWLALVGMCHGLFQEQFTETKADEAFASLAEILAEGIPF